MVFEKTRDLAGDFISKVAESSSAHHFSVFLFEVLNSVRLLTFRVGEVLFLPNRTFLGKKLPERDRAIASRGKPVVRFKRMVI